MRPTLYCFIAHSLTVYAQVSLRLNPLPRFEKQPKEYNLLPSRRETLLPKRPKNAFVFSEKDMPGYKRKPLGPRDEEESSYHGRSYLYEKNKRDSKKKENKKRFEPYTRKPIPKQTAVVGVVSREFECTPVNNEEYRELERRKAEIMLKPKEEVETSFDKLKDATYLAPGTIGVYGNTSTAKVRLQPFVNIISLLTFYSRKRNDETLRRRIVLLDFLKMSLSIRCLTYFNITSTGVLENSRRRRINPTPISVRFLTRSQRYGRVAI